MYQNNNEKIVVNQKKGLQGIELNLEQKESYGIVGSDSQLTEVKHQETNKILCVCSQKNIKIFEFDCGYENRNSKIHEIDCEESLTQWQKILRFVSFGHWYSNKSNLLAQIYDENQLSWWQKLINFVSGGYFYRTTAEIDGRLFKYQSEYGEGNNKQPA